MNTRTRLSLASVTLLVGAMTAACGGASGAPADASEKDYCKAQNSLMDDIKVDVNNPSAAVPNEKDMADAMHSWGKRMEKVGTPKGISKDARAGFETMLEQAADVTEKDLKSPDMSALEEDMSKDDEKNAQAYAEYATETCGSMMGDPEAPDLSEVPPAEAPESETPEDDDSR